MTKFRTLVLGSALGLAFATAAAPAMAQMSGAGMGGLGSAPGGGSAPQPQARTPDFAPPALPGASIPAPATGPVMQKPPSGDPTANLFAAILKGDSSAAQQAITAGANLQAQDQFGETPLDLSIALNRTSITFLLLQTRNELDAQGIGPQPMGAPWTLNQNTPLPPPDYKAAKSAPVPVSDAAVPKSANTGTPDPEAGFLGFAPKN